MLEHKKEDNIEKFFTSDGELFEIINYDTVCSMFILDKENHTATITINKEELKQIYETLNKILK